MGKFNLRTCFLIIGLVLIILINTFFIFSTYIKTDKISSDIKLEENLLLQKQRTYDSFLLTITVILTTFAIIITILLAMGLIYNRQEIKSIREDLEGGFEGNIDGIVKKTIKSLNFEERLKELEEKILNSESVKIISEEENIFDKK